MERPASLVLGDGYRLRYRVWDPEPPVRADLVLLNGIMSNAAWFSPLAPALTGAGLRLVGADRRGSAANREGWGDAPSAARLTDDVLEVIAHEHDDARPLVVVGWCWGSALAIAVTHALGARVHGLVLVTPGMFPTPAIKSAMAAERERIAATAPHDASIPSPIREEWFTSGPALDDFVRKDEQRVKLMSPRLIEISGKLATAAILRLRKLTAPVLLVLAEHDEATDNAATLAAFAELPAERVVLPAKHGVQFDAPAELAAHITAFVARSTAPASS